jgi:glutathione S-transferase
LRFWLAFVGEARLSDAQREQLPGKRGAGEAALALMERHLDGRSFFVGERISLADVALYSYTHVAEEGGFDLKPYPSIQAWLARVVATPGYIPIDA